MTMTYVNVHETFSYTTDNSEQDRLINGEYVPVIIDSKMVDNVKVPYARACKDGDSNAIIGVVKIGAFKDGEAATVVRRGVVPMFALMALEPGACVTCDTSEGARRGITLELEQVVHHSHNLIGIVLDNVEKDNYVSVLLNL